MDQIGEIYGGDKRGTLFSFIGPRALGNVYLLALGYETTETFHLGK